MWILPKRIMGPDWLAIVLRTMKVRYACSIALKVRNWEKFCKGFSSTILKMNAGIPFDVNRRV